MVVRNRAFYIFLDIAAIIVSFLLASVIREPVLNRKTVQELWIICILMIFFYLLVILFYQAKRPLMERNSLNEFRIVVVVNFQMALLSTVFLYLLHVSNEMPRSFFGVFFIFNVIWMYLGRVILKKLIFLYYENPENKRRLLICANSSNVLKVMRKFLSSELYEYEVAAVMVVDDGRKEGDCKEERDATYGNSKETQVEIYRILYENGHSKIIKSQEILDNFLRCHVIDEALLSLPELERKELSRFISRLERMGIQVNVTINTFIQGGREKVVRDFGVYHVMSYSPRIFEPNELMLKRIMDIIGAVVGVLLTFLIGIFVVPAICLESPGPPVFKQVRIGRNGRRFYIYKFRSMYRDAEERKKELESQNQMNGLMFKMKDDPRITKVGRFIRRTSIDELPQFFNVLKGDMSLVGTRPPTEEEFLAYEDHHKRRLSLKPGLTGLWQVRGRSTVTDFEEIVSMDVEYIDTWSIWRDLRILLETIFVVIKGTGAV